MPDTANNQHKDDSKEIRLFGEKSIREEAYRQKIIELEKEVMKLESLAKSKEKPKQAPALKEEHETKHKLPEYSEGIFYEAATSLDERVKKYQYMLEAKARNISDRLNLQAQNLFEHENVGVHIITIKKMLIVLSIFTLIAISMAAFSIFSISSARDGRLRDAATILQDEPQDLKGMLQESGFYNNQYTIISLNYYNRMYKGTAELHFKPHSDWDLKMIASDIISNFKKLARGKSIELNFIYEGSAYARASYSPISEETHYEFVK